MKLFKYQGAGNDFLLVDNRDGHLKSSDGYLICDGEIFSIAEICDRRYGIGADGVMLLESSESADFRMVYFNSDGSGGMMCGNGGRCIVAFAADCGLSSFDFEAADGLHSAQILESSGHCKTVRLKMKDVAGVKRFSGLTGPIVPSDGFFLDTGTRHFVRFVKSLDNYPIIFEGRDIRFNALELLPVGANVNFVEHSDHLVKVRTYEKGVEDETFACGTGIVASCISSYMAGMEPSKKDGDRVVYDVSAKCDRLSVDFVVSPDKDAFSDVWLTGPATFVAEVLFRN